MRKSPNFAPLKVDQTQAAAFHESDIENANLFLIRMFTIHVQIAQSSLFGNLRTPCNLAVVDSIKNLNKRVI